VLRNYATTIEALRCERNLAVLTSAVRDAANGAWFSEQVRALRLDAKILTGDEEAQLTFLGAMSGRQPSPNPTVVIDIGGGSTEFIVGSNHTPTFHTSLQAGVVRMSERHIHTDPPTSEEIQALAADVRQTFEAGLQAEIRRSAHSGIAVAGTATSAAAIDQRLDPYDPAKVHGYALRRNTVKSLLQSLSGMTEAERREVPGLHPDRAPTIVAGMILLLEATAAFGLQEVEVSEHDILHGGALKLIGVD
jgi:exopolyphosphatase/guanosine-5'-triphosphate,3'-diphosphate pyrophosphatase